jgi:hypothetical protein
MMKIRVESYRIVLVAESLGAKELDLPQMVVDVQVLVEPVKVSVVEVSAVEEAVVCVEVEEVAETLYRPPQELPRVVA